MGRGDKKTKRGKISMGTFGKVRPHKADNTTGNSAQATVSANESQAEPAKRTRKKKDDA